MSLSIKRTIVAAASIIVGVVLTWAIIYISIPIGPAGAPLFALGFGTTVKHFAYSNAAFLFISVACIVGIWLDYFLGAEILKS